PGDLNGEGSTGGGPTPVWFVLRNPAYTELVLSKPDEATDYLVEGGGLSLYFSRQDTVGTDTTAPGSACDQTRAERLEALAPAAARTLVPSLLDPAAFPAFTRADGHPQSAYHGHPLYLHTGDTAPGQTHGRGLLDSFDTVDPAQL